MGIYLKACGAGLLAIVLILIVGKQNKDFGMLLSVTVCCMVALAAMEYIRPVLEFLRKIESIGGLDHSVIRILLKVAGISMLSEVCSLVCSDSGNASVGKIVKFLGCSVIIWLSLPLYAMLIELLQKILGAI